VRVRIINFLKKRPRKFYRKKELAILLGITRSEYRRFRSELRELSSEGKVFFIKNRGYYWAGTPEIVQGKLVLNQKGFGFVTTEDREDIFVSSRKLKGAIHGDTVEVVLMPFTFGSRDEGQVTQVISRGTTEFIGIVTRLRDSYYLEIDPVTPRRGIHILEPSFIKLSIGDTVVAKVQDWGKGQQPILVEVKEVIGSINNPEDDMKIVCYKFDLDPSFPEGVIVDGKRYSQRDIEKELPNRIDFRQSICITIDPVDARDFDDAISLEREKNGNIVVGIHIADVGFFVKRGSELDREARKRGTSVYFSEGTVHMLPEFLSSNLCSLVPNQPRLAISIKIKLDDSYHVLNSSFFASVIQNSRKFTYREVQSILDGKAESRYVDLLKDMQIVSQNLHRKRQEQGSIDFDIPEPIFHFQNGGIPHEIHPGERLDSHRIVEEFMLLANKEVAEQVPVFDGLTIPFIYRVHDQPLQKDMERFLNVLKSFKLDSIHITGIDPAGFRKILFQVENSPYKSLIENLALRTMTKAVYSVDKRGHYGLAFDRYTHFTSPIRRYPDLIVHRILSESILDKNSTKSSLTLEDLGVIAKESTLAEIKAMEAERDYIRLKQIRWLSQHIGEKFEGIISGIISSGIFVELKHSMVEGFIHVNSLYDDYYFFDEKELILVGRKWGEKYQMGMPVIIKVLDVALEKRRADYALIQKGEF